MINKYTKIRTTYHDGEASDSLWETPEQVQAQLALVGQRVKHGFNALKNKWEYKLVVSKEIVP
jgi:hypothetical protein